MARGGKVNAAPQQAVSKTVVRQMIRSSLRTNEESKIWQTGANGNTSVAGAVAGVTNGIVEGTDVVQRTGTKITATKLNWYFQATINTLATSDRVRFILFADTQNQNALPAVVDVLSSAAVSSFYNVANLSAGRFKIFLDHVFQLNTSGNNGVSKRGSINLGSWPIYYAGSTGYGRNNLFLLEISDTPTNLSTFSITTEVRYTDA